MAVAFQPRVAQPRILGLPEPLFHLAVGALLAPLFAFAPLISMMGWYLAALVHEMGHAAASWLVGVPAVPALGITAEAATLHGEQVLFLAFGVWAASAWFVTRLDDARTRRALLVTLCVTYPLLAFTPAREVLHFLSGHVFELFIGGLFLGRALSGGFSPSLSERVLYACLGWFLLGRNLALTSGLALSAAARSEYTGATSFGIENDYARLAADWNLSLQAMGAFMTLPALAVAPAVIGLWGWSTSRE